VRFARRHWPELLLVALGVALRVWMALTYDARLGYDFESHWKSVGWFRDHPWQVPELLYSRTSYHPPLFYFLAGALARAGAGAQAVAAIACVAGCARIVLLAIGLARHLPERPVARRAALAIAAIVPVSLHLDSMVNGEALLGLCAAAAMLCLAPAFADDAHARWRPAVLAGLAIGVGLLVKVSMLMVLAAAGVVALVELVARAGTARERWRRFAPLACGLAIATLVAGWYYVRNTRRYGKPFLSAFDAADAWSVSGTEKIPYWKRRPPQFLFGWATDIYRWPYWPASQKEHAHFGSLLVATTFVDYFRYGFGPQLAVRGDPRETTLKFSVVSVWGGTLIALFTVVGWFGAAVVLWRRRAYGLAAVWLVPACATLGQIDLTIRYPVDWIGLVKGAYLQFAALPLCAAFGLTMDWLWRRRPLGWIGVAVGVGALGAVASYVVYCRAGIAPAW
jgi:4-amino-4-deoxy-L-arabinose transferase-like glycosyltransferase